MKAAVSPPAGQSAQLMAATLEEQVAYGLVDKGTALKRLAAQYGVPYVEYDERLLPSASSVARLDGDQCRRQGWFPLDVRGDHAWIATLDPDNQQTREAARSALGVTVVHCLVTLPADLKRFWENQWDVNPSFPEAAGRTTLARIRTDLARQRTILAQYRTRLAQGRTGLAFIRTGLAFASIALVLFRVFGVDLFCLLEVLLLGIGIFMVVDGLRWYLPVRHLIRQQMEGDVAGTRSKLTSLAVDGFKGWHRQEAHTQAEVPPPPTFGTTVLLCEQQGTQTRYVRSAPIAGAEQLRSSWNRLTPVMRRRFLAIDRTDLAEERTLLAHFRTLMAKARTGLAFARTGIAFSGLGIALLRQFPASAWNILDCTLILIGIGMALEGFSWYVPGRKTSRASDEVIRQRNHARSVWGFFFRPFHQRVSTDDLPPFLSLKARSAPGIWGSTGLALERTLIAERRNVKSRLRTVMSRSRTGLSFIRTGASFFTIGLGLQAYFGAANIFWTLHNCALMLVGVLLIGDGLYWHLPAERIKKQLPYCTSDLEIVFADYATPASFWKKVVCRL